MGQNIYDKLNLIVSPKKNFEENQKAVENALLQGKLSTSEAASLLVGASALPVIMAENYDLKLQLKDLKEQMAAKAPAEKKPELHLVDKETDIPS